MSHPTEAWKFKLWSEAMLRGATVGKPEYKGKATNVKKRSRRGKRNNVLKRKRRKDA